MATWDRQQVPTAGSRQAVPRLDLRHLHPVRSLCKTDHWDCHHLRSPADSCYAHRLLRMCSFQNIHPRPGLARIREADRGKDQQTQRNACLERLRQARKNPWRCQQDQQRASRFQIHAVSSCINVGGVRADCGRSLPEYACWAQKSPTKEKLCSALGRCWAGELGSWPTGRWDTSS